MFEGQFLFRVFGFPLLLCLISKYDLRDTKSRKFDKEQFRIPCSSTRALLSGVLVWNKILVSLKRPRSPCLGTPLKQICGVPFFLTSHCDQLSTVRSKICNNGNNTKLPRTFLSQFLHVT